MFQNNSTPFNFNSMSLSGQPPAKISAMDTSAAGTQQQPFSLFGNKTNNAFNFSPGMPPVGNATAANAANTPLPTFNWGNNAATTNNNSVFSPTPTPLFGTTSPPAFAPSLNPAPFNFAQSAPVATPTQPITPTFSFQQPQQQQQTQVGLNPTSVCLWSPPTQPIQQPVPNQANAFQACWETIYSCGKMMEQCCNYMLSQNAQLPAMDAFHQGCGIGLPSPQMPLCNPLLPYQIGRPSSFALECLQMAATDLQRSNARKNPEKAVLWKARDRPSHRALLPSSTSSHNALTPTRQWASTSLADSYRKEHYNYHRSPESKCSNVLFEDRNTLRRRASGLLENYYGHHPYNNYRRPSDRNRSLLDYGRNDCHNLYLNPKSFMQHYENTMGLEENYYTTQKREVDRKWKVLNDKVVKESLLNNPQPMRSCREASLSDWKPAPSPLSDDFNESCNSKVDYRNREHRNMWDWINPGLSTGPPLRSHLDDKDYQLYEDLRHASNPRKKVPELRTTLPGKFKYDHDKLNKTMKNRCSFTHELMKKDIEVLYQKVQSNTSIQSTSEGNPGQSEEKTSEVFFSDWKDRKKEKPVNSSSLSTVSSETGIQTDPPSEDDYFRFRWKSQNDKDQDSGKPLGRSRCSMNISSDRCTDSGIVENESSSQEHHPSRVTLTREGYYCNPSVASLDRRRMGFGNDGCYVRDFEVGHREYGTVVFPGFTKVADLNLDKIVTFGPRSVIFYPPDLIERHKYGEGLNRPCKVTLFKVWPRDGKEDSANLVKNPKKIAEMGYEARLRKWCYTLEAEFLSYCPEHGKLTFMIQLLPPSFDTDNNIIPRVLLI